jgi:hypothetical protein
MLDTTERVPPKAVMCRNLPAPSVSAMSQIYIESPLGIGQGGDAECLEPLEVQHLLGNGHHQDLDAFDAQLTYAEDGACLHRRPIGPTLARKRRSRTSRSATRQTRQIQGGRLRRQRSPLVRGAAAFRPRLDRQLRLRSSPQPSDSPQEIPILRSTHPPSDCWGELLTSR